MFQRGDPKPDPVGWGSPKWSTEGAYDEELGVFLGNLACNGEVPEAGVQGLARRALVTAGLIWGEEGEPQRLWPWRFAKQVIDPDCASAKGLPDATRRELKKLAARGNASALVPEASQPEPAK